MYVLVKMYLLALRLVSMTSGLVWSRSSIIMCCVWTKFTLYMYMYVCMFITITYHKANTSVGRTYIF